MDGTLSIPKVLAADPALQDGQKLLLTLIASTAKPDRPCDLTLGQFAGRLGKHRTTIGRWIVDLSRRGYLLVQPYRPPLPRVSSRRCYQLPVRLWRLFLRAWAMVGGVWRKVSRQVKDWIEPRLPLFFLADVDKGGSRRPPDRLCKTNLPNTPVRGSQAAPDPGEQLSFQALLTEFPESETARGHRLGLQFVPERFRHLAEAQAP